MDEEHLTFPVVALPLEMTREDAPLYRTRLMWIGFLIPAVLHTLEHAGWPLPDAAFVSDKHGAAGLGRVGPTADGAWLNYGFAASVRRRVRVFGQYGCAVSRSGSSTF